MPKCIHGYWAFEGYNESLNELYSFCYYLSTLAPMARYFPLLSRANFSTMWLTCPSLLFWNEVIFIPQMICSNMFAR